MTFIDQWNQQDADDAAAAVVPCCGSRAWAASLASRRPLSTLPELLAASDAAWWNCSEQDHREAFAAHPRIGERHAVGETSATSLRWSKGEQSALATDNAANEVASQLIRANQEYEERFGHVFLIRAAGRDAAAILSECRRRMHNTPEAELHEAAEQQREITHLRLQRWLSENEVTTTP